MDGGSWRREERAFPPWRKRIQVWRGERIRWRRTLLCEREREREREREERSESEERVGGKLKMRRKRWGLFVFLKGANRARPWDFSN